MSQLKGAKKAVSCLALDCEFRNVRLIILCYVTHYRGNKIQVSAGGQAHLPSVVTNPYSGNRADRVSEDRRAWFSASGPDSPWNRGGGGCTRHRERDYPMVWSFSPGSGVRKQVTILEDRGKMSLSWTTGRKSVVR
jgi:hypothetical protein